MGRLIVSQFVTVDGVAEDPGGSEDFERGGWAFDFERGEAGDRFKLDEVMEAEALLLGRTTYEGFAAAWPSREGEFADKFNGMAKHVVSSTLGEPEWENTKVIDGEVAAAVARLKRETEGDVLVNGSLALVPELLGAGLVDELRLMVFPVVLGAGKRLFAGTESAVPLALAESIPAGETTILVYRPAG